MNRFGSRIDAMYAVERKGAEMSIRTLARAFIVQLTATSVFISAPESS
jgi:hypothetical protein